MTTAPFENTKLEGGRTYCVHSVPLDVAEALARTLAAANGFRCIPFIFEQGDRETVEQVRAALLIPQQTPTLFFIASNRPYTHDSQALILKALEELHATVAVMLHVRSKEDLLATIRSRAIELTTDSVTDNTVHLTEARNFLKVTADARLKKVEVFIGNDEPIPYTTDDLVRDIEKILISDAKAIPSDTMRIMHDVLSLYHDARRYRTIPPKTLFEYLAVSLPVV